MFWTTSPSSGNELLRSWEKWSARVFSGRFSSLLFLFRGRRTISGVSEPPATNLISSTWFRHGPAVPINAQPNVVVDISCKQLTCPLFSNYNFYHSFFRSFQFPFKSSAFLYFENLSFTFSRSTTRKYAFAKNKHNFPGTLGSCTDSNVIAAVITAETGRLRPVKLLAILMKKMFVVPTNPSVFMQLVKPVRKILIFFTNRCQAWNREIKNRKVVATVISWKENFFGEFLVLFY